MNKPATNVMLALLVAAAICAGSFFLGDRHGRKDVLDGAKEHSDTVVRVVTKYKDFPDPVASASVGFVPIPRYMFFTDTLTEEIPVPVPGKTDTVYLPREQKYYEEEEGRLRLWVSGYDPRLDRYELDAITTTVNNTVYAKPSRWSFTISAGWGLTYGIINRTIDTGPTVLIGGSYSF